MKIKIDGMSCQHCKMAVEKALSKVPGVKSYSVDLDKGEAQVSGNPEAQSVIDAIDKIGYRAKLIE
ncbi:MAG: heavy-metal-associated domain-containing protein [candidate division KSB1 bacterium]|nr:heavy-metal-associated domain-containing protein [candidate division KSB1 bacterium]